MTKHFALEVCKRLRSAGFPQDESTYWWVEYVVDKNQAKPEGEYILLGPKPRRTWNLARQRYLFAVYALPTVVTADGKGGVLPFLVSLGWRWGKNCIMQQWCAHHGDWGWLEGNSPEALVVAMLDVMEVTV